MSEPTNVAYPPYPPLYITAVELYRYLDELNDWADEQRGILLAVIPANAQARIIQPTMMASPFVWSNVSVMHQYNVLLTLRHVREMWDKAYREFEDAWDSQAALKFRFSVVVTACNCMADAFTTGEQQEARHTHVAEQIIRENAAIERGFKKIVDGEIQKPDETDPYAGWGDELEGDS